MEEIHHIQEQFVDAAVFAKQAGIDAVTLHGCHGYLIAEFLSPVFNQRRDEYGGSFENRCRFLLEIIEKCRKALGPKFPIMVRYSANEYVEGGRGLEESVALAKVLESAGVAAIDISASQPSAYLMTTPPYCLPHTKDFWRPTSEAIKKAVEIPVFTAIGIRDPEFAEELIREGKADLIAFWDALSWRTRIMRIKYLEESLRRFATAFLVNFAWILWMTTANPVRGEMPKSPGGRLEFDADRSRGE